MVEKPLPQTLRVVGAPGANPPPPPANLGDAGRRLWNAIQIEFDVSDIGGRELLGQCCETADRVASLGEQIARDGETIRTKGGIRAHPLLAPELAARAFIVRTLMKLGICYEPLHLGPGRPAGKGAA